MATEQIAVIVAHPDDEVLGFGGAIAHHAKSGDAVHILILATGLASRSADKTAAPAALDELREQAQSAATILQAESVEFADFPDNAMDSVPLLDVVVRIESFLSKIAPTTLYTHHMGDLNVDHGVTARAVLTACRPLPGTSLKKSTRAK